MFETEDLKGTSQGEQSQGETNPASWSAWTPNQHVVIDRLLGRDADLRPTIALPSFRSDLGPALRARLEEELESVAQRYSLNRPLAVNKHHLASVFHCEGFLLAEEAFAWTLPKLRGSAMAKAMSLLVLPRFAEMTPLDLAEVAVERMQAGDEGIAEFLAAAPAAGRGELTLDCADLITKYRADWPPLAREWIPRIESPSTVSLLDGRILLKAKYDLALGHPGSNPSDVVIVDFKTGSEYPEHIEETRHYALLEAIRTGVPPRKVSVDYVNGGYFRDEDVSEETLLSALRRTVDGVRRIDDLWTGARAPNLTPGTTCLYCPALAECGPGQTWTAARREERRQ